MATDTKVAPEPEAEPDAPGGFVPDDSAARLHLLLAAGFLVLGVLAGLVLALKLTWPGLLAGAAFSFGRLAPAHTGALLVGWLLLAQVGIVYALLPRITGAPLWRPRLALANLVLLFGGALAGVIAVIAGEQNGGGRFFEFPWYVDLPLAVGIAVAALVATKTVGQRREPTLYVSAWFFIAGLYWMVLTFVAGNLWFTEGLGRALVDRFAGSGMLLLWALPVGIGVAYYLVPKLAAAPLYSRRLAAVSFWALALTFPLAAPRLFVYGPAPDWYETIGGVFAIAALVAILAVAANLALTLQGRWGVLRESPPLRFVAAGMAFFTLMGVQLLGLAFRASSATVQFTTWVENGVVIAVLGAGTMLISAAYYHLRPSPGGAIHLALSNAALAVLVGVNWAGGMLVGYTWSSAPVSGEFENFGEGWVNTTGQLVELDAVRWVAWAVLLVGVLAFDLGLQRGRWADLPVGEPAQLPAEPEVDPGPGPVRVGAGALALWGLAFVLLALLPIADRNVQEDVTLTGLARDFPAMAEPANLNPVARDALAATGLSPEAVQLGWEVYIREGCVTCHTQQVRAVVTDVGLGPITRPGDLKRQSADLTGYNRNGPDLAHAGSRSPTDDRAWLVDHLLDPQAQRPWSTMPSYDYLTETELDAVAQYIVYLR